MIKNKAKNVLKEQLKEIEGEVALLLSRGVDSHSLLFELLEQQKQVVVYSFTMEDRESSDFKGARKTAEHFGLPFVPIYLPVSIEQLQKDVLFLIQESSLRKKTEIECTWAMMYALKAIKEHTIVSGLGADGHFVISKRGCIHYKFTIELMNEFRNKLFSNPNYAQQLVLRELGETMGKRWIHPYLSKEMIEVFKDTSWEQLNKPRQKQLILDMYPTYFHEVSIHQHTNFQLGDSGIAEHFTNLMKTDWNKGKGKTVISLYNAIARGEIS